MGVSLQTYRVRIGTFQPKYSIRTNKTHQVNNIPVNWKTFLLVFLLSCSLPIFVHLNQDSFKITSIPNQHPTENAINPSNLSYNSHRLFATTSTPCTPSTSPPWPGSATQCSSCPYPRADPWPPPLPNTCLKQFPSHKKLNIPSESNHLLEAPSSWLTMKERNSKIKSENGNRGHWGRGIKLVAWNKGNSLLQNKHPEIENIIAGHQPHILGLSEANLRKNVDPRLVQHEGYTLHTAPTIDNPAL